MTMHCERCPLCPIMRMIPRHKAQLPCSLPNERERSFHLLHLPCRRLHLKGRTAPPLSLCDLIWTLQHVIKLRSHLTCCNPFMWSEIAPGKRRHLTGGFVIWGGKNFVLLGWFVLRQYHKTHVARYIRRDTEQDWD